MSRVNFLCAAALLALSMGSAALADADYPAANDPATVSAWLAQRTNIKPSAVVTVTPGLVVALVAKATPLTPEGPVRVTLREEVIAPAFIDAVGGRSSLMTMEIQCEERRLRMDERHLYSGPNLSGAAEVSEPSTDWLRIPEDTVMEDVAHAACDASYAWPLQAFAPVAQPTLKPEAVSVPVTAEASASKSLSEAVGARETGAKYAIQIGAYRNAEQAQAAWKVLSTERPLLTRGYDFDVRPVKVKGKELLRGLVLNFKSPQERVVFCAGLSGTAYGCILRTLSE